MHCWNNGSHQYTGILCFFWCMKYSGDSVGIDNWIHLLRFYNNLVIWVSGKHNKNNHKDWLQYYTKQKKNYKNLMKINLFHLDHFSLLVTIKLQISKHREKDDFILASHLIRCTASNIHTSFFIGIIVKNIYVHKFCYQFLNRTNNFIAK